MPAPAWYPTPEQELLLRAALLDRGPAERAWVRWRTRHGENRGLDLASFRLLPLVYRNLAAHGSEDPWISRLKGVYRRSWVLNQSLVHAAADVVARLERAGIPSLLFKGAGLSVAHYRDLGVRPMTDVDVAVPLDRAQEALGLLSSEGMRLEQPRAEVDLRARHGETLLTRDDYRVDLHWALLWQPGPDDEFWDAAVPIELRGVATRTLCATDHVLHVCAHGAFWNPIHPVRWVIDVCTVLRSAPGGVDWQRLVRIAGERELTLPLHDALVYANDRFDAQVPATVLEQLRAHPVRRLRRAAHRVAGKPPSLRRSTGLALVFLDTYRASARHHGERTGPLRFVDFVQHSLQEETRGALVQRALRSLLGARRPGAEPEADVVLPPPPAPASATRTPDTLAL